ncbi:MAG: FGGY family carbohydrate kinase, partial [Candidatus Thorarchaeota archaeon]
MNEETSEKKYILAIDHGTSAMKVAIADQCGEILAFEWEDTPLYLFPDGGAEQDPDEWWTALITATTRLLSKGLVPIDDIAAICVSSQWSGTVAVDSDGNHLMNAVIWMDSRGEPYIKK